MTALRRKPIAAIALAAMIGPPGSAPTYASRDRDRSRDNSNESAQIQTATPSTSS